MRDPASQPGAPPAADERGREPTEIRATGTSEARGSTPQDPAPAADEPAGRLAPAAFLAVAVQLGLLVLVIRSFHLEGPAFERLALLTLGGFLVHAYLPLRHRLPFFVLLSLVALFAILGWQGAAWVVGIGGLLIGICHLPGPFRMRVALLLAVGVVLALMRFGRLEAPWPRTAWAVLGSMFMFRMIVYFYDLQHEKEPFRLSHSLAYFFLLPNVCFPLFPVVDYKTFRRTYFDADAHRVYQQGVDWMLRGVTHLLLYRVVYYHLTLAPAEVETASDLLRYLVTNLLLYLRISGQFHLIVGMLKLFGFNLPETNHLYFLASSFSDYWRRINIYWKDFMMKVFYYPLYFRLRKRSATTALTISTLAVFLASWALHSYQWFWLQGSFPIKPMDAVFWGTVGFLVLANALYERRFGRRRSLGTSPWTWRRVAGRTLATAGTFAVICVLWAAWTSESLGEWVSLWSVEGWARSGGESLAWISGVMIAGVLLGTGGRGRLPTVWRSLRLPRAATTTAGLALLCLLALPAVQSRLGTPLGPFVAGLQESRLNRQDTDRLVRGYYERLLLGSRFDSPLVNLVAEEEGPAQEPGKVEIFEWVDGFLRYEIRPGVAATYLDAPFSSNRWGMRDRDYELAKPPGTYRIAVLGSSHTMGHGVGNGQIFEALLEEQLNREGLAGRGGPFEILNFAVDTYSPQQQVMVLTDRVLEFQPDALFYVGHTSDVLWARRHLYRMLRRGIELPYPELLRLVREAGIDANTPKRQLEKKVAPLGSKVVTWAYGRIAEESRQRGVAPIWIFVPTIREYGDEELIDWLIRTAEDAGFEPLVLDSLYADQDRDSLQVSASDIHPNSRGHALIAERILASLRQRPGMLWPGAGP